MSKQQDVCEGGSISRWLFLLALFVVCFIGAFAVYTFFERARDPNLMTNYQLRVLGAMLILLVTGFFVSMLVSALGRHLNRKFLRRFTEIESLGCYVESMPQRRYSGVKEKHAVLLLHGFTASPQDFFTLYHYLDDANVDYYAPSIFGFGASTTEVLETVRFTDWFRSALSAYDSLAAHYEQVSVVGNSLGAAIALYVCQHRPVKHLVLISPGVFPAKEAVIYKKAFSYRWFAKLFKAIIPYVPKPKRVGRDTTSDVLDDSIARHLFQYLAVPVNSVQQAFYAQDYIQKHINDVKYTDLLILTGRHDLTIDARSFVELMNNSAFVFEHLEFTESAHSLLEDFDKARCCFSITQFLTHA